MVLITLGISTKNKKQHNRWIKQKRQKVNRLPSGNDVIMETKYIVCGKRKRGQGRVVSQQQMKYTEKTGSESMHIPYRWCMWIGNTFWLWGENRQNEQARSGSICEDISTMPSSNADHETKYSVWEDWKRIRQNFSTQFCEHLSTRSGIEEKIRSQREDHIKGIRWEEFEWRLQPPWFPQLYPRILLRTDN